MIIQIQRRKKIIKYSCIISDDVQKIKIEYAQAEDYPVDLYYLMDLSNSMKDDKQKLSDLGQLLVESMSNITNNFRLGFGSFVDKVVMPYVSMVPKAWVSCKFSISKNYKQYVFSNIYFWTSKLQPSRTLWWLRCSVWLSKSHAAFAKYSPICGIFHLFTIIT